MKIFLAMLVALSAQAQAPKILRFELLNTPVTNSFTSDYISATQYQWSVTPACGCLRNARMTWTATNGTYYIEWKKELTTAKWSSDGGVYHTVAPWQRINQTITVTNAGTNVTTFPIIWDKYDNAGLFRLKKI